MVRILKPKRVEATVEQNSVQSEHFNGNIEEHIAYATKLAHQFYRDRQNLGIDRDDFVSAAKLGLCDAASRFDPTRGQNFKTFSYFRIRGAMYDLLRQSGGISRNYFNDIVQNSEDDAREHAVTSDTPPRLPYAMARDSAELMRLSALLEEYGIRVHTSSEDGIDISYSFTESPESSASNSSTRRYLAGLLDELPDRERTIIEGRYYRDTSFDQLSDWFGGVSKSWISRLHTRALGSMREMIIDDGKFCELRMELYRA